MVGNTTDSIPRFADFKIPQEDKPVVDSILERMRRIDDYNDKIKHLTSMRQNMIDSINKIDSLIADFERLKQGIS